MKNYVSLLSWHFAIVYPSVYSWIVEVTMRNRSIGQAKRTHCSLQSLYALLSIISKLLLYKG
jgi:hypothetical protein